LLERPSILLLLHDPGALGGDLGSHLVGISNGRRPFLG
jgi:hypothetical protein